MATYSLPSYKWIHNLCVPLPLGMHTNLYPLRSQQMSSTPASYRPPGTSPWLKILRFQEGLAKAAGSIWLPNRYAARASRYATPAQRVAFIALLIDEWTIIIMSGTCQLSSVHSPCLVYI